TSVGRLDEDYSRYLVLATAQFTSLDDIRNTVVAVEDQSPLWLRDIAEVRDGIEDPRTLVYGNGQPGALISIARQIGGNILEVADQINDVRSHLGSAIPPTLRLTVVYDLAGFVREAMASGLVIDDAVVVIENIYRHLGLGEPAAVAAERGTQELLGPVIGSTATTVVVFSPLSLLSGVVGEFFTALCLTLVVAVLLSLLFALTLIP